MRIALLSSCSVPVPPLAYGGIERFVATLAEGLVARGHEVIVYATGDSRPAGRLRYRFAHASWPIDFSRERAHAEFAWRDLASFEPDVVHCNLPDALCPELGDGRPTVVTIHHQRLARLMPAYRGAKASVVALSRDHAGHFADLGPPPFIHHGLAIDQFPRGDGRGGYAAFLGRIGPEKAPHAAMEAAQVAGMPLKLAGPHWTGTPCYDAYFADVFAPALARHAPNTEWIGELDASAKRVLLGSAAALLMPLGWDEPFGLVVIESMLVGTPVIAFRRGSMPELVEDGVTGFVVDDVPGMARALARAAQLDRRRVRERARARFDATIMTTRYESCYRAAMRAQANGMRRAADDAGGKVLAAPANG